VVSHLGDVLELLFAGPDPTVAVHAVIDERHDAAVAERAATRLTGEMKHGVGRNAPVAVKVMMVPALASALAVAAGVEVADRLRRRPRPAPRGTGESRLELWLGPTGRVRMERAYAGPDGPATATATVTIEGARSGSGDGLGGWPEPGGSSGRWPVPVAADVERHFAHQLLRRIVAGLELREAGAGEVAGRPVVVVRATRRGAEGPWPHWLPFGADGYELRFDREYSDLLAYRATFEGEAVESATVASITYGDP
jgi:hypothetical protein